MITGVVNAELEALIRLAVRGGGSDQEEVLAVVDTGFNGALTLPAAFITRLELPWRSQATVELADGSEVEVDVYAATIVWDGAARDILLEEAETDPLVGMALLEAHRLEMEVIEGGNVLIEAMAG